MPRLRPMTDHRLGRILGRGGMVAPVRQVYLAYRGPDTRHQAVGWVSPHLIARRLEEGGLSRTDLYPDRFVAGPALRLAGRPRAVQLPPGWEGAGCASGGALATGLMSGRGGVRLRAAAGRFRDEFQRASCPAAGPVRALAQTGRPQAPSDRLAGLEAGIGTPVMRRLEDLLVDQGTLAALCVRWSVEEAAAQALGQAALDAVARAYDLLPAADSPA